LSLGAVALDLLIALVATSLIRNRLGLRAWRWVHWAAYICWPVALVHGFGAGTDRGTLWVFMLTIACAAVVVGVATWRFVGAAGAGARCPRSHWTPPAPRSCGCPACWPASPTTIRPGWPSTRICTGRCRCPCPHSATGPGVSGRST